MRSTLIFFVIATCVVNVAHAQYFLVFKAISAGDRGSIAGHAFVSFVKKDEALNQTIVEHTWGFHPVSKSVNALFSTDGEVEITKIGDLGTSDLVIEVDQITYEYSKKLKHRWNAKKYGILANQNCIDFIRQMAELIIPDLSIPSGSISYKFPRPFLENLRTLNYKRDMEARKSLSIADNQTSAQTTVSEDFDTFIKKFSKDKIFQLSRVKFPFKSEIQTENIEKRFVQRNQWKHQNYSTSPFLTSENSLVENWHKRPFNERNTTTERLTACGCAKCECGYFMYHTFRRVEGKWYLTSEVAVSN